MAGPFSWIGALARLLRHRWNDPFVRRALPESALQRLTARIAASERRHTGQIRICAEGGLPWSYLLRQAPVRERALMMFSKLRVWDTEHNNGVLIYLLLAEHSIDIVADRGLRAHVASSEWQQMVARMSSAFRAGHFEQGLDQAVDEVTALLCRHFPIRASRDRPNELPDEPHIQ
ncbi:TPM domain-containing protein [Acidovorax soli]|uniref:TPM domain-containing protein n=1 Tax=Acidovorax TaxID=12916 RepID=UPI0026EC42D9|nr:TPM domain-containing protein [Acidovorax soli]MCM2346261.1 TPM domain-containing protein [Acidovorax soli]